MRLRLDDEYLIDCDEQSVNLIRERIITGDCARGRKPSPEKIGTKREEVMGFYGTIEQALVGYMNKAVQGMPGEGDVKQLIEVIREVQTTVLAAVKSAKWSKKQFVEV